MNIYLISMKEDVLRRSELERRFPIMYKEMYRIDAINGKSLSAKEYFFYAQKYLKSNKKMITPSELGCTLSHIKALQNFLTTDEDYCLILEDDVIGCDQDIILLENLVNTLPENSLMLCGGQEGLSFDKYILGKNIGNNIFSIPRFSTKFLSRTCCYIVDKRTAKKILISHDDNLKVADHWHDIFKNNNINFLFFNLFKHPVDLKNSHIECEREYFYENNFWKRVLQQGFFLKVFNRLRNDVFLIFLAFMGYKKVKKGGSVE
ncbi:glycosyltransferase family 25 protein [Acinetobacter haemolyticus]|uniref:glycosyltransferase family 25 protein n=1 Tax=Acinetobacter haemolyticus TaxID=29430 RepID=UPI003F554E8C